ncbi:hypothetical protein ElyMa_000553700 [Elysia marginata]|uniref:Amino acid transporter transmembrane domain-containing protein n=1 Tax=Elysia marginata TaxID=1093978 RepID=A0AAV4G250_9GAST|nr:hypothetical protein ElyMa_000553700 [Elysia marginata]
MQQRSTDPALYPSQATMARQVRSRGVTLSPPPPPHYPSNNKTAPSETPAWFNSVQSRLKVGQTIVPSVLACVTVQAVAAFFLVTAALTFDGAVRNTRDFSDDKTHDGNVLYIVFSVFSALAAALCAPLIQTSGYTIVLVAGTILLMFSTLSSSVVNSAQALVIPFSLFGACAYGLLKTCPQIAMLDFLNDKRDLAAALSYLGVTIGQLVGVMSFSFSDMVDDAVYAGSGNARWPNNLRVIEVTAVLALIAATVIKKPSFSTGSWPELFQLVPFYILCLINFFVSFGFDMIGLVFSDLPAVVLGVLALASFINKPAYKDFPAFAIYGSIAGFAKDRADYTSQNTIKDDCRIKVNAKKVFPYISTGSVA